MFYVPKAYVFGPYVTCAAMATEPTTRSGHGLMSDPLRQITTRCVVTGVSTEPTTLYCAALYTAAGIHTAITRSS